MLHVEIAEPAAKFALLVRSNFDLPRERRSKWLGGHSYTSPPSSNRYGHHIRSTCPSTSALAPTTILRQRCPEQPVMTHSRLNRTVGIYALAFEGHCSCTLDPLSGEPSGIICHRGRYSQQMGPRPCLPGFRWATAGAPPASAIQRVVSGKRQKTGMERIRSAARLQCCQCAVSFQPPLVA